MDTDTALFHDALIPLLVPKDDVTAHPRNARNGDIEAIAESIQTNGCYRPVIAQRSSGHILAGNHTYYALLSLGAAQIPVVWVECDDVAATRILLADNRTADLGNYDNGLLVDLLDDLAGHDSLMGTGYLDSDLRELHKLLEEETPIESQDPDYGWPVLHLRVHPSARTAFYGMTDAQDNDADRFVALLRKAGWTGQIRRG